MPVRETPAQRRRWRLVRTLGVLLFLGGIIAVYTLGHNLGPGWSDVAVFSAFAGAVLVMMYFAHYADIEVS